MGSWTRRRPIGRDYAAAKDVEGGKSKKVGRWEGGKVGRWKSKKVGIRNWEVGMRKSEKRQKVRRLEGGKARR